MEFINIRRSVRSFLPTKIEKEKLEVILKSAMQAPSAKNQQPWRFLVIENRETLNSLVNVSPNVKMLLEAPCAIVVLFNKENLLSPLMAPADVSAATLNILLQATELGIGSCWCGIYPNQERINNINTLLKIPDNLQVFSIIALGYPKELNALHYINRFDPNKIFYEKF